MVAPFADFVIPGPIQSGALLIGTGLIAVLLYTLRPPLTQATVLGFLPWIVSGAILHVLWQLEEIIQRQLYPPEIDALFSAPAIYLTMFILVGAVWIVAASLVPSYDRSDKIATYLAVTGVGVLLLTFGVFVWQGTNEPVAPMEPIWPVLGLIVSLALTFVVYLLIGTWRTYVIAETRYVGAFVIFAHVFDAVTTTIGVDILGADERSAAPRMILDVAADLPTAELLGTGWLFLVVKVVIASAIVVLFADYVNEKPREGTFLLAVIGIVGFGPALNNFFLFLLSP